MQLYNFRPRRLKSRRMKEALFATGFSQDRTRKAACEVLNGYTLSHQAQPTRPQNRFDVSMTPGARKTIQKSASKNVSHHGMLQYRQRIAALLMNLDPSGPRVNRSGGLGATGQDVAERTNRALICELHALAHRFARSVIGRFKLGRFNRGSRTTLTVAGVCRRSGAYFVHGCSHRILGGADTAPEGQKAVSVGDLLHRPMAPCAAVELFLCLADSCQNGRGTGAHAALGRAQRLTAPTRARRGTPRAIISSALPASGRAHGRAGRWAG